MVNFGQKILANQYQPWAPHYLDYAQLKDILKKGKEQQDDEEQLVEASINGADSHSVATWMSVPAHPLTVEFLTSLHRQLEKILLFVLQEQGRIAIELAYCRNATWQVHQASDVEALIQKYRETGLHLLRLVQFLDTNVTGMRKIIKKHDKVMKGVSSKISTVFWQSRPSERPRNLARQLAQSDLAEPLLLQNDSLGALAVLLEKGLLELREATMSDDQLLWSQPQTVRKKEHVRHSSTPAIPAVTLPVRDSDNARHSITQSKGRLENGPKKAFTAHGSFGSTHAAFATAGTDLILIRIQAARQRLKKTNEFVHLLASSLLVERSASSELEHEDEGVFVEERPPSSTLSNFLNLLSTFLYMMNYYIVAPTSGSYAAKLGGDPSLSAMIIGMTPIAALVSTVLFSWWTNHSYKTAVLFASTCSWLGNFCYAMALPRNSLTWVMVGRLLNGFGSARSINRRYIADTFSRSERTAASAAFVTAGALGMAAGPAVASFLHFVTPGPNDTLYWQVENAPGWFMLVLWSIYLGATALYFQDPPKRKPLSSDPTIEMPAGEKKPLLTGSEAVSGSFASDSSAATSLFFNIPVMTTFFVYFVLKLVLEAVLSSCATLTSFYFEWDPSQAGFYLAGLGLLMLPANLFVAYLARRYDDRELIVALQVVMLASCLGILKMTDAYPIPQYIAASVVAFVSTNALEGPNMSLLSKTIPSRWSSGIINVGLLATEAGTAGRAVGDVLLSTFGSGGLEFLLNRTFGSFAALSTMTLGLSIWFYEFLEPIDKDD